MELELIVCACRKSTSGILMRDDWHANTLANGKVDMLSEVVLEELMVISSSVGVKVHNKYTHPTTQHRWSLPFFR